MLPQYTLTLLGLAADFAGFCLLLREWWTAFLSEQSQVDAEEQVARRQQMRALRNQHSAMTGMPQANPFASLERLEDDMHGRRMRNSIRKALASRRRMFALATVLIVLGFMLQFVGAVPKCCPALGIAP